MIDRNMIAPAVHRVIDLTGGPVNILVPPGQAYRFYNVMFVGQDLNSTGLMQIGQKNMFWQYSHSIANWLADAYLKISMWNHQLRNFMTDHFIWQVAQEGQNVTFSNSNNSGTVRISYIILDLKKGFNEHSDGGKLGKRRTIVTWGHSNFAVPAGGVQWGVLNLNDNPAGETTFPWVDPVNPDRRYFLHALIYPQNPTIDPDLTLDGIRLVHEGRDLITPEPIVVTPAQAADWTDITPQISILFFPEPYGIDSNEVLQVWLRATSAVAGANLVAPAALLMTEEFMKKD